MPECSATASSRRRPHGLASASQASSRGAVSLETDEIPFRGEMNDRLTTATPAATEPVGTAARRCQAEGCSLPLSSLPWLVEIGWMTLELWLCQEHGTAISQANLTFDDEVAA